MRKYATDANGDVLTITGLSAPAHGTVTVAADGSVRYDPAAGYMGQDAFTYQVQDTLGAHASGSVTIDLLNRAPAAVSDSYSTPQGAQLIVAAGTGVLANDSDPDGDTLTVSGYSAPAHGTVTIDPTGSLIYTPASGFLGVDTFRYDVTDPLGALTSADVTVNVTSDKLTVQSFAATASGFQARFSRAFDASVLNLYSGVGGVFGAADLTLSGPAGAVQGSLLLDSDHQGVRFIATGGVLSNGSYNVVLKSGTNAFKDLLGRSLDGNTDGVLGDDYATTFTVSAGGTPVVSLPDFVRGPGQAAVQPQAALGLPVTLSGAGTFLSARLEVHYDPATLQLMGVTSPTGGTVQADLSTPGLATITVTYASAISGDGIELVRLTGQVPVATAYGDKRVLEIRNVVLAGSRTARGDDALQVVAFSGDVTRDASYTTLDMQRMQRILAKQDSAFGEWPLVDPTVIADVSGNSQFNSSDATIFLREISTTRLQALSGGQGSLVELEFQVSGQAKPGAQLVDLQWARLNDSHLTLGVVPEAGWDPTDALLRITPSPVAVAPAALRPESSSRELPTSQPGATSRRDIVPLINWSMGNQLPGAIRSQGQSDNSEWLEDFVNKLGKNDKERNPNSKLRIPSMRR